MDPRRKLMFQGVQYQLVGDEQRQAATASMITNLLNQLVHTSGLERRTLVTITSKQQVFDVVATYLLAQVENDKQHEPKTIGGALVPNDKYEPWIDEYCVTTLCELGYIHIDVEVWEWTDVYNLLLELQLIHNFEPRYSWHANLIQCAGTYVVAMPDSAGQ